MVFAFGDYELDVGACELRRCGHSVPVQPKVFDTLRYLIEHRDRVVSKRELLDVVWAGQQVNRTAVAWSINHARRAIGQRGAKQRPIETVRGQGYRFRGEVIVMPQVPPDPLDDDALLAPTVRTSPRREPFLGRNDVMNRLAAALDDARRGIGRLCLLTGEAGIGKTRCADELVTIARRSGFGISQARCVGGGAPAFWPWIQILRECAADARARSDERKAVKTMLDRLTPRTVGAVEGAQSAAPALSDTSRFWLSEGLARCLREAACKRMHVVVVDDVHLADEGSLEALSLLAHDLAQTRMVVVATARNGPTAAADAGLATRLRPCEVIALSALEFEDVERYIADAIGRAPPVELARAVHAKTAGNPLFLKEAARLVAARLGPRGLGMIRAEEIVLPEVARGFLHDRLGTLGAETREVLGVAAVIGEEFELAVLQRVVDAPFDRLVTQIDAAANARFVVPRVPGRSFAFAHALIREALYEAHPAAARMKLHERVADALRPSVEPRLSEIAYHLHLAPPAENAEAAARFGRLAGDAAMQVFAYEQAAELYTRALGSLAYRDPPDARATCELLLASAFAFRRAGRVSEARANCERAIAVAREKFPELLVAAARSMRPTVWMAQVPDDLVLDALEQARKLLSTDSKATRARTYGLLAGVPPYSGNVEVSLALGDEAVALARELGNAGLLTEVLVSTFPSLAGPDSIDRLLSRADEVLALDGHPISWWSAEAFFARYNALLQRGDSSAADRALTAFGECARLLRMPEAIWQYERVRAQQAVYAGDFDRAQARFQELLASSGGFRAPGMFLCLAHMGVLHWERTEHPLPVAAFGAEARWKWAETISAFRAERILSLIESCDPAAARADFENIARDTFRGVTRDMSYLYSLARLALGAVALEREADARTLYGLLQPYASFTALNGLSICLGSVSHFLGVLARFLEMRTEAAGHFEDAIAMNTRLGHKVHTLRSQLALAELLHEQYPGALVARAQSLANEALAGARALGLEGLAANATRVAEARP